jgi:integrative and conjugative element protein (TIGR02256 family)
MLSLFRRRARTSHGVLGRLEGVDQRVEIGTGALTHVRRFRQTSPLATEAGGQLFGTITPELILVTRATGPYPHDERSRYRYRSDPTAAQRAIQQQSQAGLLYIGEWHTHAEDCPDASGLDDDAMRLILQRSRLNSNALLMLIVGRRASVDGLGLWTVAAERVHSWTLEDLPSLQAR